MPEHKQRGKLGPIWHTVFYIYSGDFFPKISTKNEDKKQKILFGMDHDLTQDSGTDFRLDSDW